MPGHGWAWTLLAVASLAAQCAAEKREVYSCRELWDALAGGTADHVVAMQAGSFNCTATDLTPSPVPILGREVLLEGQGPGLVYIDFNQNSGVLGVAQGGNLTVRNLWVDDCLGAEDSAICIALGLEGGRVTLADMRMSDTGCVDARRSSGIAEVHNLVRFTLGKRRFSKYTDARSMLVPETGWLNGAVPNSQWRITNSTFTCTGNLTHPLPEGFVDVELGNLHPALVAGGAAALLALAAGLLWFGRTRGRNSQVPEYRIAESRGYVLEAPLGSGHFGRVYRGRKMNTGQLVAIKVLDLLPHQRSRVQAAYRECQLLTQLQHECILRVVTFYTAKVARRQIAEFTPDSGYIDVDYQLPYESVTTSSTSPSTSPSVHSALSSIHDSSSSGSLLSVLRRARSKPGSGGSVQPPGAGASNGSGANAGALLDEQMEGVLSIQVQLVTDYCDMGTLDSAVKKGMFRDADGEPRLRHMLATALEIARGLEYLQQRRMVHRDLSANNVLLTTSAADDRGFRALLSDFGLSTVLSDEQTHKTSQVKGTLSYMSPEMFNHDSVSPALDIYSLGVLLHLMFAGKDPYHGQLPLQIMLAKIKEDASLPPLEGCPTSYQRLVHDCTVFERRARPTAAEVVRRLEALLAQQPR